MAGCGGAANDGGSPVPVGGSSSSTTTGTPSATLSAPTAVPSDSVQPTSAPPKKAQVIMVAGNFASNPAVQGLVQSYPLYFQSLVSKDDKILRTQFPSFFYSDVSQAIVDARTQGWVMKPPGSVVVRGVQNQPNNIVRVTTCRSQTTQYWDPRGKKWSVVAPNGTPQVIDMIKTGLGWRPYKLAPSSGAKCAGVRYPA
ncbi:hypothetical protein E1263_13210 [Kribbella antibiotica]|uniref:Uncharacterized protein n=1 Tax=Kribbella antibiotica TaxID=190195 RepID=A0A4R4ZNN5_9ACTN|nr:hypothetical protein E1263_13210 [Kribbella antibiotica]